MVRFALIVLVADSRIYLVWMKGLSSIDGGAKLIGWQWDSIVCVERASSRGYLCRIRQKGSSVTQDEAVYAYD